MTSDGGLPTENDVRREVGAADRTVKDHERESPGWGCLILPALWTMLAAVLVLAAGVGTVATAADAGASPSPAPADGAAELGRLFPASLDGQSLEVAVWTGPEWLARYDTASEESARALDAAGSLLAATGASADEITVGAALLQPSPGNVATLDALQVADVDGYRFLEAAVGVVHPEIARPALELDWTDGRTVFRVRDLAVPGSYPVTAYAADDIVWFISAGGAVRDGLLAQLPPPPPPAAAAYELAGVFPAVIGGSPRDLLSVQSGSWGMPAVTQLRLDVEQLSRDVVLLTGADRYDLETASGLSMRAGLLPAVTAWQVAGADEALMRRVRDEILLPRIGRGETQVENVQVGGRELLQVSEPGPRRAPQPVPDDVTHLYVSGDTIWWLEAEEAALVELVEQLP